MTGFDLAGDAPDPERVAALKKLRRGGGIHNDDLDAQAMQTLGFTREQLNEAFEIAMWLMPPWRIKEAIANALGSGHYRPGVETLMERRAAFALENDISLRTVIRWEEHGAVLLLEHMDRVVASRTYPSWILMVATHIHDWASRNAEEIGLDPVVARNGLAASYKVWEELSYLPPERQRAEPLRVTATDSYPSAQRDRVTGEWMVDEHNDA